MSRPHVVQQGEYLTKIAYERGVDAAVVWDDPKNAELKKLRGTGDILHPGDVVYLPDDERPAVQIEAGTVNRYVADPPKVKLALVFHDGPKALANEACEVAGLGGAEVAKMETAADGTLELDVPVTTRELTITFPAKDLSFAVSVGDMDPEGEASGMAKRLCNLGYLSDYQADEGDAKDTLRIAVLAFQKDHGIDPSGDIDDATRSAIMDAHEL
jgi:N-acetylmuramoyl-L-alanine amidase